MDIRGYPKGPIEGNQLCWLGNLEFVIKDVQDPSEKLLTHYNYREKMYKGRNIGVQAMQKSLSTVQIIEDNNRRQ